MLSKREKSEEGNNEFFIRFCDDERRPCTAALFQYLGKEMMIVVPDSSEVSR